MMMSFSSATSNASRASARPRPDAIHDVSSQGKTVEQHISALTQTLQSVTEMHGMATSIVRRMNHQVPAIVAEMQSVDDDVFAPPQVSRAEELVVEADAVLMNLSSLLEASGSVLESSNRFKKKFKSAMNLRTPEFGLSGLRSPSTVSSPDIGSLRRSSSRPILPPLGGGMTSPAGHISPAHKDTSDERIDQLLGRSPGRRARSVSPTREQQRALSSSAYMMGQTVTCVGEEKWSKALTHLAKVEQVSIMNRVQPPAGAPPSSFPCPQPCCASR